MYTRLFRAWIQELGKRSPAKGLSRGPRRLSGAFAGPIDRTDLREWSIQSPLYLMNRGLLLLLMSASGYTDRAAGTACESRSKESSLKRQRASASFSLAKFPGHNLSNTSHARLLASIPRV